MAVNFQTKPSFSQYDIELKIWFCAQKPLFQIFDEELTV